MLLHYRSGRAEEMNRVGGVQGVGMKRQDALSSDAITAVENNGV